MHYIYLLWLSNLLWWLYDEKVSSWAQRHNIPDYLISLLQNISCALCVLSCCSWVLNAVGLFVGGFNPSGWLTIRINLNRHVWNAVQVLSPKAELFPARARSCQNPPFGVLPVWLVGSSSSIVWSPPLVVLVLGPLRQCSGTGWCQILCVTSLWLPVCSYHSVHCLWLCLLYLDVCGRNQSVYKGWLSPG